jgi:hypothetical protein
VFILQQQQAALTPAEQAVNFTNLSNPVLSGTKSDLLQTWKLDLVDK